MSTTDPSVITMAPTFSVYCVTHQMTMHLQPDGDWLCTGLRGLRDEGEHKVRLSSVQTP
jgi:hypothetical protein